MALTFRWRGSPAERLQVQLDAATRSEAQARGRAVLEQAKVNLRARSVLVGRPGGVYNTLGVATRKVAEGAYVAQVGSNSAHAEAIEEGTGIYGPRGTVIRPRTRRFMVFQSYHYSRRAPRPGQSASRITVFTPAVRGQRAKHFLRDALPAALRD